MRDDNQERVIEKALNKWLLDCFKDNERLLLPCCVCGGHPLFMVKTVNELIENDQFVKKPYRKINIYSLIYCDRHTPPKAAHLQWPVMEEDAFNTNGYNYSVDCIKRIMGVWNAFQKANGGYSEAEEVSRQYNLIEKSFLLPPYIFDRLLQKEAAENEVSQKNKG